MHPSLNLQQFMSMRLRRYCQWACDETHHRRISVGVMTPTTSGLAPGSSTYACAPPHDSSDSVLSCEHEHAAPLLEPWHAMQLAHTQLHPHDPAPRHAPGATCLTRWMLWVLRSCSTSSSVDCLVHAKRCTGSLLPPSTSRSAADTLRGPDAKNGCEPEALARCE